MNTFESLEDKITKAKELDFGEIINKTFELFKKTWLNGFLLVLVLFVVLTPVIIALYMPMYQSIFEQIQNGEYDPNDSSSLVMGMKDSFRYMILAFTFFVSFLSTALGAGFYRLVRNTDFGDESKFSTVFYFFKGKYLGKIFAIASFSLMISLIGFVLEKFLPQNLATFINLIISFGFSVYSTLFVLFLAFNPDLDVSSIFSLSFNLGTKKWLLIFGLLIVTSIIGMLGAIACGIGVLFTFSIVYLSPYLIYKEVIGFNTVDDLDLIGKTDDYE